MDVGRHSSTPPQLAVHNEIATLALFPESEILELTQNDEREAAEKLGDMDV